MITYDEALNKLFSLADATYRDFHKKLLKNENINVIGVRIPLLRNLAKEWKEETDLILLFPDEYYEITFLKCTLVGQLPYESFVKRLESVLPHIDNWATCDCFKAKCIKNHREEFLPKIKEFLHSDLVFTKRYALVTLLSFYMDKQYLPFIFESVQNCGEELYYVMMACAWLIAEVLVKFYEEGVSFLKKNCMPVQMHNRAIRKACESYRLNAEQKEILKSLRRFCENG